MPSNAADVPSDATSVPSDTSPSRAGEGTGQQRSERLRARRDAEGLAQVTGWVPKDRRAYAREVIAALARGSNSLPPDPEQGAALDVAQAAADAARAAEALARAELAQAGQREQALAAELKAARAEGAAARDAGRQAEAAAVARAEAAERAQEATAGALRAAEAAAAQARTEAERFRQAPGLRGRVVRWLARDPAKGTRDGC